MVKIYITRFDPKTRNIWTGDVPDSTDRRRVLYEADVTPETLGTIRNIHRQYDGRTERDFLRALKQATRYRAGKGF